ncbi:hypothetical protein HIM_01821 [Hirsutella minnesotensis 3608]|nr:hypothetical protein HIM_01821 [Hirsutella minnesotensis 3608]
MASERLQVIALVATGIPLYRQPILGQAECHDRDYDCGYDAARAHAHAHAGAPPPQGSAAPVHGESEDETESMVPLLRAIRAGHPQANAVCSGAILSTYQRTRVESVALRLGLVPLAYLWKYPMLPPPSSASAADSDDAQLLRDMAAAGLEARIIKVASAGLDEAHLWQRVTSDAGAHAVKRALRKFGAAQGSTLGEGGEFETIVLDGPARLFRKRIAVPDDGRAVVAEGGGCSWLMLRGARVQDKPEGGNEPIREPGLLDPRFRAALDALLSTPCDRPAVPEPGASAGSSLVGSSCMMFQDGVDVLHRSFVADTSFHGESIEDETLHVVDKIRAALSSTGRGPTHITNTIIALRDMDDFSKVNDEYSKLFTKPNPPSRVTICCGHLLPEGSNIMIHTAVPATALERGARNGLHVQARSYWAPANIGPYSQAIDVPVTAGEALRSVYVAGQIPLVPATMSLPAPSATSLQSQVVLSLQHLWRIGVEMKVQCWTSAVAYFARSSSADDIKSKAELASRAWSLLHAPSDDEEEAESGPDVWNLKYDAEYASMGSKDAAVALPDWSIFTLQAQNDAAACVPPVFAVEVESLPRQSCVEWHAHVGLGQVSEGCAEMLCVGDVGGSGWRAWHMLVRNGVGYSVHTVLACGQADGSASDGIANLERTMARVYADSFQALGVQTGSWTASPPYLAYVDAASCRTLWHGGAAESVAYIPCHSIWSPAVEQLTCVALYRATIKASR